MLRDRLCDHLIPDSMAAILADGLHPHALRDDIVFAKLHALVFYPYRDDGALIAGHIVHELCHICTARNAGYGAVVIADIAEIVHI